MWRAGGNLDADNGKVDVDIHPEHRSKIEKAGYFVSWDVAGEITGDDIPVVLVEADNGRRRVAAVLKLGTEDEWIEVVQKIR